MRCCAWRKATSLVFAVREVFWCNTRRKDKIEMLATLNGQTIQCADLGVCDMRMNSGSPRMQIKSYYPDIGRGSIEHSIVSHEKADSRLECCGKKSLFERLMGWLDV